MLSSDLPELVVGYELCPRHPLPSFLGISAHSPSAIQVATVLRLSAGGSCVGADPLQLLFSAHPPIAQGSSPKQGLCKRALPPPAPPSCSCLCPVPLAQPNCPMCCASGERPARKGRMTVIPQCRNTLESFFSISPRSPFFFFF